MFQWLLTVTICFATLNSKKGKVYAFDLVRDTPLFMYMYGVVVRPNMTRKMTERCKDKSAHRL